MTKRRPSGDGMVRKRADGRWEGRIVVGHKQNGDPIFRYVLAATQKELLNKLHQNIEAYRDTELAEDSRMTLSEWLDRWLDEYVAGRLRESTLRGYRVYIGRHIKPHLGSRKISSITTADVQRLYTTLKENGRLREDPEYGHQLSDAMICRIHSVLHRALADAKDAQLILRNPTEGATVPKPNYKPKKILTDAQLDIFLETIQKDPVWHDFFYTELTTGLRRGEICGLQWQDFDPKAGTLRISRTLHKKQGGGFTTGETKTGQGRRVITLPHSTAELLRKRQKTALTEWIFPDPLRPELPTSPGSAYSRLKTLLKRAGLPDIRFHDLRHTFATHALAKGVDAKTLSDILGHTNASFTLDTYTHVTGDMQKQASVIVGNFMEDIFGKELKPWQNDASKAMEPSA